MEKELYGSMAAPIAWRQTFVSSLCADLGYHQSTCDEFLYLLPDRSSKFAPNSSGLDPTKLMQSESDKLILAESVCAIDFRVSCYTSWRCWCTLQRQKTMFGNMSSARENACVHVSEYVRIH
eukprot:5943414-Amphidinium_carterae.3